MQYTFQKTISNLTALKAALIVAGYVDPGIVTKDSTLILIVADDAPDPTSFINSYNDPGRLVVTSDRPVGSGGAPACPADGASVHTLTIKNVDANGDVIPSSITVLPIPTHMIDVSPMRPVLASGVVTCTVGPANMLCDIDLSIVDQAGRASGTSITVQFV